MITDFGIARLAADAEAALPGTTLGLRPVLQPRAGPGRDDDAGLGRLRAGPGAVRGADRPAAVGGETAAQLALARVGAAAPSPRDVRATSRWRWTRSSRGPRPGRADRYSERERHGAALEPRGRVARRPPGRPTAPVGAPRATPLPGAPARSPGRREQPSAARRPVPVVALVGVVTVWSGASPWSCLAPTLGGRAPSPPSRPTATTPPSRRPRAQGHADAQAAVAAADAADPILDVPCSLGAARYAPAGLRPAVDFTLGKGGPRRSRPTASSSWPGPRAS